MMLTSPLLLLSQRQCRSSVYPRPTTMTTLPGLILPLISLLMMMMIQEVNGILPTAQLTVYPAATTTTQKQRTSSSSPITFLASQASFGPLSPMMKNSELVMDLTSKNKGKKLVLAPSSNSLLCDNVTSSTTTTTATELSSSSSSSSLLKDTIIVVPRGECTYQLKAYHAQQLGAVGVVIYNTLESRYSINTTTHEGEKYPNYSTRDIIFPQSLVDYDCSNGEALIPSVDLQMHPLPYNAKHNDPLLGGNSIDDGNDDDNLCQMYSTTSSSSESSKKRKKQFQSTCPSQRCLITSWDDNSTKAKACCAWDLHVWLYNDPSLRETPLDDIQIPSIFLTMEQGDELLNILLQGSGGADNNYAIISSRWRSDYNMSSIIIWLLGVFVAGLAAYLSAGDYHQVISKIKQQRQLQNNNNTGQEGQSNNNSPRVAVQPTRRSPMQEETLELEPIHAVGFVIMASTSLFILFYFKIYNVVKVMYAIGCSNAVVQVIVYPLLSKLLHKASPPANNKPRLIYHSEEFGDITNWDVYAAMIGYAWGMTWLYMALKVPHPDGYLFFWLTQDILGACMCIVFLGLIQLNSIQVASILLIVAFFYDIFFVFVTPYLFKGKSIMITVATSGGPPTADPSWCEKYPSDPDCQGGDPLPMLLTIPRLFDFQGGSSLLGLGDIVLPGLLISFAARLDAAKSLVGMMSGGRRQDLSLECRQGACRCCKLNGVGGYYFVPVVIAYAIGLLMANIAVYVMDMGQPALLYLVPCTLGTMAYLGWKRHELRSLWDGPNVLRSADQIVYGAPPRQQQPQQQRKGSSTRPISGTETTAMDEEEGMHPGEETHEDDEGDVPLLQTSSKAAKAASTMSSSSSSSNKSTGE